MALFGEDRDASFIRSVNREFIGNVVTQQCIYYKYKIGETKTNIYGEATEGRYFQEPIIFNCLINRNPQENIYADIGVNFSRKLDFNLLKDDLVDASLVPEVGDVIMYHEGYYEIVNTVSNQLFAGKNPDYPNSINPLNPGLEKFGYDLSVICNTVYINSDKLNILKSRL